MKLNSTTKNILAIGFLLLTYWQVTSMIWTMKFDMMDWFYPMRYFVGECLQNQVLPTWNPYTNLGYPIHADPQSGALYPVVWVLGYFLGYSVSTIHIEFLLHIIIGFWGMKKLAQELGVEENVAILVGVSYACCGFFIGNAQHLSWIISAAWIPIVACWYLKLMRSNRWQDALGLSIFTSMMLVGGYPAFTITMFYLMGLAFIIRLTQQGRKKDFFYIKRFVRNNLIFGIAFLIQSLAFIKHFLESMSFMVRTESLSIEEVQLLPYSPQSFFSFVLPGITGGNPAFFNTDSAMANGYFGLIALVFLIVFLWRKPSRKTIWVASLSLFFLMTAMGDYFYLRAFLYYYVPMMDLFRYPALFRVFSLLGILLLVGWSFQRYGAESNDQKKLRIIASGLIIGLIGLWIYAVLKSDFLFPSELSAKAVSGFFNQSNNSQMVMIQAPIQILLLGVLIWKSFNSSKRTFLKTAGVLLLIDLFLAVQINTPLTITSDARMSKLQQTIDEQPNGFPIPQEKVSDVIHQGGRKFYPIWYNQNLLTKKIAQNGYNNLKYKAFRDFNDSKGRLEKLKHQVLYLSSKSENSSVKIQDFTPNEINAEVDFFENGELTLLQYFYPGWKVEVDGIGVTPFMKEDIFLALKVPKGKHQIRLFFYPDFYWWYLLISFGNTILLAGFLCFRFKFGNRF